MMESCMYKFYFSFPKVSTPLIWTTDSDFLKVCEPTTHSCSQTVNTSGIKEVIRSFISLCCSSNSIYSYAKKKQGSPVMKCTVLTTLIFAALASSSLGAFCKYYQSSNSVRCGQITCLTANPDDRYEKTPVGFYYVGRSRIHKGVGWFNLYPQRSSGGYWDYHTKVPEFNCRGGFGLHYGWISEGCITVTDLSCFNQLRDEITNNFPEKSLNAHKCRGCWGRRCLWTSTVQRTRTSDLQVYAWTCSSRKSIPVFLRNSCSPNYM